MEGRIYYMKNVGFIIFYGRILFIYIYIYIEEGENSKSFLTAMVEGYESAKNFKD